MLQGLDVLLLVGIAASVAIASGREDRDRIIALLVLVATFIVWRVVQIIQETGP